MFPDYPEVHAKAARALSAAVRREVVVASPVLGQVRRFVQHEGRNWNLRRADGSEEQSGFELSEATATMSREALKTEDHEALRKIVVDMAEQIAEQQSKHMFARISQVVEEVGNRVDAGGDFGQEHFLEMLRRKQINFDPETLEPSGEMFVVHPDTFAKIEPKLRAWEQDEAFRAAHEAIMEQKRSEWREREASRKLVD